jgi:hypothetical protein
MQTKFEECYAAYIAEKVANDQLKIVGVSDLKHQAKTDLSYQKINQIWKGQECCVCMELLWNPHMYMSHDFSFRDAP